MLVLTMLSFEEVKEATKSIWSCFLPSDLTNLWRNSFFEKDLLFCASTVPTFTQNHRIYPKRWLPPCPNVQKLLRRHDVEHFGTWWLHPYWCIWSEGMPFSGGFILKRRWSGLANHNSGQIIATRWPKICASFLHTLGCEKGVISLDIARYSAGSKLVFVQYRKEWTVN